MHSSAADNRSSLSSTNSKLKLQSWRFVERVLDIHHELQQEFPIFDANGDPMMTPVGVEEMARSALRFFCFREEFEKSKKPIGVDVGYHYTRPENLNSIVRFGLLGRTEQSHFKVEPTELAGNNCGDGVYVAKDPISFSNLFGTLCIMTARGLWGNQSRMEERLLGAAAMDADTTWIRPNDVREFVVLKRSSQCLPIFSFQAPMIGDDATLFRRIVFCYHEKVQALLDALLEQSPTELPIKDFGIMISKEAVLLEIMAISSIPNTRVGA
jgi:nitroreductase